jgi:integrase
MLFISKCGKYYYLYYDNPRTGKRTKVTTKSKTKAGAYEFLSKFGANTNPKPSNVLMSQLGETMLSYAKIHFAPRTVAIYDRSIRLFYNTCGNIQIKFIDQRHFERYKSERIFNKISPVTINIELRTLKAMFNYAIQWQLLDKNPSMGVKRFSTPQKERLAFTETEIQKILNTLPEGDLKNIVIVGLTTGCRIDEILNLQWRDVDLTEQILIIQNKPTFKTKTGKMRYIPISDKLSELLTSIYGKEPFKAQEQYIFRNFHGIRYNKDYISRQFKKHLKKINLPDKYHFHCLRHTFITQLARKGVNIYDIKQLAGHSDIKTTELYMHSITDDLRKAVNLI